MTAAAAPMLFLPPHAPVPLDGRKAVVIGRSRSCDLRLPENDASRRHAEIVPVRGGFVVRDLGSTNGTFVNGEQVQERQINAGDRIQIGSATLTFCMVGAIESACIDAGDEKTVMMERPSEKDVFQGDLAEIPPFAVLQVLEMGRNSGLLSVDSDAGPGRIWFGDGAPLHAETKTQSGFDAALAIANATSGRFRFEPGVDCPEPTLRASVTEVLLEAARLADEGS
jgi:hypothetical protein